MLVARKLEHDVPLRAVAFHDLALAAAHDRPPLVLVERHLRLGDVLRPLVGVRHGRMRDDISLGHGVLPVLVSWIGLESLSAGRLAFLPAPREYAQRTSRPPPLDRRPA